eukprot:9182-Heterococcus_DN1.PRE.3
MMTQPPTRAMPSPRGFGDSSLPCRFTTSWPSATGGDAADSSACTAGASDCSCVLCSLLQDLVA